MSVEFGAFYENGILSIEAFDLDNYASLPMGVITAKPLDVKQPTTQEKNLFTQQVTNAIQYIANQFAYASLHYQGPSKSQGGYQGWRPHQGNKMNEMSPWANFIWNELQVICNALNVTFKQKIKTSKPKTKVKDKNKKNNIYNFNKSLKFVCRKHIDPDLTAPQRHCFAAALGMGNTKKGYQDFVKKLLTHHHVATGQPLTKQAKYLINQQVLQIPFAA